MKENAIDIGGDCLVKASVLQDHPRERVKLDQALQLKHYLLH
jgi:hypothetical protein